MDAPRGYRYEARWDAIAGITRTILVPDFSNKDAASAAAAQAKIDAYEAEHPDYVYSDITTIRRH